MFVNGVNILKIDFRQASLEDAELPANIYNASFYRDHIRFGVCPGYGRTKENMEASIKAVPKFVISCNDKSVGCVSCIKISAYEY